MMTSSKDEFYFFWTFSGLDLVEKLLLIALLGYIWIEYQIWRRSGLDFWHDFQISIIGDL